LKSTTPSPLASPRKIGGVGDGGGVGVTVRVGARVRVGVGRPDSTDPEIVSAHVLGRFREDPAQVRKLVERAADRVQSIVLGEEQAR